MWPPAAKQPVVGLQGPQAAHAIEQALPAQPSGSESTCEEIENTMKQKREERESRGQRQDNSKRQAKNSASSMWCAIVLHNNDASACAMV